MSDAAEINPLEFDTWIYAMEAYRANIEATGTSSDVAQGNQIATSFGPAFIKAQRKALMRPFTTALSSMDEAFKGQPELLENAKDLMDFCSKIMDPASPYPNAFRAWITQTPEGQEWLTPVPYMNEDGTAKSTDQIRVDICEEMGQAMMRRHEELGLGHSQSVMFNEGKPQYLVQTEDGRQVPLDEDKLVALVRKKDGPHIIMTGNHCWLEQVDPDITMATKPIKKLLKAATGDVLQQSEAGPVQPNDSFEFADGSRDLDALTQKDTLLVTAAYTRENNFLNLAQLFDRLINIKAHVDKPLEDTFEAGSPSSHQFVTTMLKIASNNPDAVTMPSGAGKPGFVKEGETLRLSADAPERMRDVICYAFSQGGNSLRDAMRMLVHACHSDNVEVPQGKDKEAFLKEMMASISMTVAGLNEAPMVGFYGENGAHVALITGHDDSIAPPPQTEHTYTHVNPLISVSNKMHAPSKFVDAIMVDERTRARVMSHLAPLVGRASVAVMDYHDDHTLEFELGPTTHKAEFEEAAEQFTEALLDAGVENARIEYAGIGKLGRRIYHLQADNMYTPEVFEKISHAIQAQAEVENQPLFFNCIAKVCLEKLQDQVSEGKGMKPVEPEIEAMYRERNTPQVANDNGVPVSKSLDVSDAIVAPMMQEQQQVAM